MINNAGRKASVQPHKLDCPGSIPGPATNKKGDL